MADEAMCRPIRQITESKGHETSAHVLAAFGGAGPQHACAVARRASALSESSCTASAGSSPRTAWV